VVGPCKLIGMFWLHSLQLRFRKGPARARAAQALGELGNSRAVDGLARALLDRGWDDRWTAAMALGKLGSGRAVESLGTTLLGDPGVDVRCSAAWALGQIGGRTVIDPLVEALEDPDRAVRRAVAEALGEVRTPRAVEGLMQGLADPDHDVRLEAVRALGEIGSGRAATDLLEALEDPEWSVRTAAAEAVTRLQDSRAVEPLIRALDSGGVMARIAAAEALGEIGDPQAVEALAAVLDRALAVEALDLRLRRNVARALGAMCRARSVPPLLELADDPYTAGVAVEALALVLRWDAESVEEERLAILSRLEGLEQVPWMIDESSEELQNVPRRRGRAWAIDTRRVRELARRELDRRGSREAPVRQAR